MTLNKEQSKSLANFFFDVAKGLILGGIGFATVLPWNIMLAAILSSAILAYICIRIGLSLLKEI